MDFCTIWINNVKWKVCRVTEEWLREKSNTEEGHITLGYTEYKTQKIYFVQDCETSDEKHTLRHELMHAYLYSIGGSWEEYDEEDICNFYSRGINSIEKALNFINKYYGGIL